ncbi:hypothetical protein SSPS47_20060 [Streptomyces sp. S4.7]|nr:hypothetical protein SSPS47_20060 [Streptomyces sp. S4.7]
MLCPGEPCGAGELESGGGAVGFFVLNRRADFGGAGARPGGPAGAPGPVYRAAAGTAATASFVAFVAPFTRSDAAGDFAPA